MEIEIKIFAQLYSTAGIGQGTVSGRKKQCASRKSAFRLLS
jgi:hypothetical protein